MSESTEQQALIQWFKLQYPKKRLFAIPNGSSLAGDSRRKAMQMNKLKREGLIPGVSDLFLCVPTQRHAGLFLEMKDKGKTPCSVSEDQARWIADMKASGYMATWAAGLDKAKAIIQDYISGYYNDPYYENK